MSPATPAELITVQQAEQILDAEPVTPRIATLPLSEVLGLRLAEPLRADRDDPNFDKSLMDGFAVRSADLAQLPVELKIVGSIAAGAASDRPLNPGEAVAIMTGAPLPPGADRVVPVEDTVKLPTEDEVALLSRMDSIGRVRIVRTGKSTYIASRGSDCATGSIVLNLGAAIGAAQLAAAASVGATQLKVFARPRVALLTTGDELVPIDRIPAGSQRRDASVAGLRVLLERLGCRVNYLGIAPDDPEQIKDKISTGLAFDALLITGGMSMGEHDYVPKILADFGTVLKITKLRIKPGKPFIFGKNQDTFVFGLPGNPVSAFVCTLVLAARLLRRMAGDHACPRKMSGKLELPLERNSDRDFYQPAIFDGTSVWPLRWKSSADIYTLAQANALIIRPADAARAEVGEVVPLLEIPS